MSTRANIIIRDELGRELIFYRHSDSYPEEMLQREMPAYEGTWGRIVKSLPSGTFAPDTED